MYGAIHVQTVIVILSMAYWVVGHGDTECMSFVVDSTESQN